MSLTVKQLIAQLRKMPPDAKVCVADHDQEPDFGQFSGAPSYVRETGSILQERGYGVVIGS